MVEIPKNTYSVSADPVVEETIRKCVEALADKDTITIARHPLNDFFRRVSICVDHDSIGYEVVKHFIKAGYHGAVLFFSRNMVVNEFSISKKPIECGSFKHVIG